MTDYAATEWSFQVVKPVQSVGPWGKETQPKGCDSICYMYYNIYMYIYQMPVATTWLETAGSEACGSFDQGQIPNCNWNRPTKLPLERPIMQRILSEQESERHFSICWDLRFGTFNERGGIQKTGAPMKTHGSYQKSGKILGLRVLSLTLTQKYPIVPCMCFAFSRRSKFIHTVYEVGHHRQLHVAERPKQVKHSLSYLFAGWFNRIPKTGFLYFNNKPGNLLNQPGANLSL